MLVSAVIPTYKREHLLKEAVESVLRQQLSDADFEIIVVNDSGEPLAIADWQRDLRVRIVDTYCTERSVARNTGAALSRGDYLHFLDDDDTILPGAYCALLEPIRQAPDVVLSVGCYEAIFDEGLYVRTVKPVTDERLFAILVAGIGIPLGACLIKRDSFFNAGCFDPAFTVMEDLDLLQRLVMLGRVESVGSTVARFRMGRHQLSTTTWEFSSQVCRLQREKAFQLPGCYAKIKRSLRGPNTSQIRGNLVRYYLGSSVRHIINAEFFTAMDQFRKALGLAIHGLSSRKFWHGLSGQLPAELMITRQD